MGKRTQPLGIGTVMEDANLEVLGRVGESERPTEQVYEVKMLCCGRVTLMSAQSILRRAKDRRKHCAACSNKIRAFIFPTAERKRLRERSPLSKSTLVINGHIFPVLQAPETGSLSRLKTKRSEVKSWEQ